MSKLTTICQPFFNTSKCPNGAKCILKHVGRESASPNLEGGRTFTVLPFSDLRPESHHSKDSNSKVSSNTINSKSHNNASKLNIKQNNINNLHEMFPSLSKAQKKRNRRKGKVNTSNEKVVDRMNEKNLCEKSKVECNCKDLHGDVCDLCSRPVLHPLNVQFRKEHSQQCVKEYEARMKEQLLTFRSAEKQCGICFEPVMAKKGDRRFAILPDCNHCFCLVCIKIWRKSAGFGKAIRKSCPECRVVSHYVCPSTFWVETKQDKADVLQKYKSSVAQVDCKYYSKTERCPFWNKCFYKHCKSDGTPVDVGPPRRQQSFARLRRRELMMDALYDMIMNDDSDNMSEDLDHDYDYEFDLEEDSDDENFEFFAE